MISKYFYEKEFCVKNGIYKSFDVSFDNYLPKIAREWNIFVNKWLEIIPNYYKYEEFLTDTRYTLKQLCCNLSFDIKDSQIDEAVAKNTKTKNKTALDKTFPHNTFIRKGIAGDWRNYFNARHISEFKRLAGKTLIRLKYEKSINWSTN